MNDHNLDDLIIDNIRPKNSKTKSFLTIIALAIVMLIIAIILTKIILKNPESEQLNADNNTVYVSPELTLQEDEKKEESVQAPLIPTTEAVKPETHTETLTETVAITNEFADTKTEDIHRKALEKEATEAQNQIDINEAKAAQQAKEEAKKQAIIDAKRAEALAAKKAAAAKLAEEQAKQAVDKETTLAHPYFIQVGSFSKTPSPRFLSVIKSSGFHYQITAPSANGTKKLLIGPYATKPSVDTALIRVKDRINKSAYIIRK